MEWYVYVARFFAGAWPHRRFRVAEVAHDLRAGRVIQP